MNARPFVCVLMVHKMFCFLNANTNIHVKHTNAEPIRSRKIVITILSKKYDLI